MSSFETMIAATLRADADDAARGTDPAAQARILDARLDTAVRRRTVRRWAVGVGAAAAVAAGVALAVVLVGRPVTDATPRGADAVAEHLVRRRRDPRWSAARGAGMGGRSAAAGGAAPLRAVGAELVHHRLRRGQRPEARPARAVHGAGARRGLRGAGHAGRLGRAPRPAADRSRR